MKRKRKVSPLVQGTGGWRVGSDMGALSLAQGEMDEVSSTPPPSSRPGK